MTNVKKENQKRILIYEDKELTKEGRKNIKLLFAEINSMKARFMDLEIGWNKEGFIKTLTEGAGWIGDSLKQKIESGYQGPRIVVGTLVKKEDLMPFTIPIEENIKQINSILSLLSLSAKQIEFDNEGEPILNESLKKILADLSRQYAEGPDEVRLFHAVQRFISSANDVEALLYKAGYGLMFTHLVEFAPDICTIDDEKIEELGHCILKLNPYIFADLNIQKIANENMIRDYNPLGNEVSKNHSSDVPPVQSPRWGSEFINKIEGQK